MDDITLAYRVVVALSSAQAVSDWVQLAQRLCPREGEIHLRGCVTVAEELSLSEGANQARLMRTAFEAAARLHPDTVLSQAVRVDYHPFNHVLDELHESPPDLLLVEWAGPTATTGGLLTNSILGIAPCDVVLLSGEGWAAEGAVLLSLRGGPNMTLGLQTAKALCGASSVTLFHVADKASHIPDLHNLIQAESPITRIVTEVGTLKSGLQREAATHKTIVLGARYLQLPGGVSTIPAMIEEIHQEIPLSLALVRSFQPEEVTFHVPRPVLRKESLSVRVDRWFAENNFHSYEFADLDDLLAQKRRQGVTISLGLPALNEEATIGKVIETLKTALMDDRPLLDEIILIDSNSTDNTVPIAESFGIPVYRHPEIMAEMGSYRGKGEALWKSLSVMQGDIVAWVDTDITNIHPRFVYGLIGPLLKHPRLQYVKSYFQRPLKGDEKNTVYGGGRVTELMARPLINLFYPELSGVIQPLSGQYAGRRAALEQVPFFSGYGVEMGLLIDMHDAFGLEAIAQTDLEELTHHNQPLRDLSKMSFAILQVFTSRLEKRHGITLLDKANRSMKLITQTQERFALDMVEIGDIERPAMASLREKPTP